MTISLRWPIFVKVSIVFSIVLIANLQAEPVIEFIPDRNDETLFNFETDEMSGTIRTKGNYHGVSRLIDKRTGKQVIDERYSALNLFKLMSVNQVMDQPRKMESEVTFVGGQIDIRWPASEGYQGTVNARYEISGKKSIDLIITTKANATYRSYEVFLSSYFDKSFQPYVFLQGRGKKKPELVLPRFSEVFKDSVLVFARDFHAMRPCGDGRWQRSERGEPNVQMTAVRPFAKCLAIVKDPESDLGVVLTAKPEDCYAISTRYYSEKPEERNTSYTAFDLSLFGDDFSPGESRSVRVRLSLTKLDEAMTAPFKIHEDLLAEKSDAEPSP